LEFPIWLRFTHFVNLLFLTLLIRSGIQILADKPKFYWNDHCKPGTEWLKFAGRRSQEQNRHADEEDGALGVNPIVALPGGKSYSGLELGRSWHYFCVGFWVLNGLVYVTLLFCTGEWKRLIPTTLSVFPEAWQTLLAYVSLHWVGDLNGHYNALQQLTYATVVFVFSPLTILTGAAISPTLATRYPWYPGLFGGRQSARSIHFLLLAAYLAFVCIHVSIIVLTDFPLYMNRIVLGIESHKAMGMVFGMVGIALVVLLNWAVTIWSQRSPEKVEAIIGLVKSEADNMVRLPDEQEKFQKEVQSLNAKSDDEMREEIRRKLVDEGLKTQMAPFPENNVQFDQILAELRALKPDDLEGKLVIAGFYPKPVEDQRCLECMYYLVHRKWCDIPELAVPVEPDWWCRLWRI
jgi:methionine sulfoxide reductase catalytic subunit